MTKNYEREEIMKEEIYYLASPYTSKKESKEEREKEQEDRFNKVKACVADIMMKGKIVVSPIVACHQVSVDHDLPGDYLFWHKMNLRLMVGCSALAVLKMPGWDTSVGLLGEIQHAHRWGMRIVEIDPETLTISEPKDVMMLINKSKDLSVAGSFCSR